MSFEVRPNLVIFRDTRPRSNVALSVNGVPLRFRQDASHFDDGARTYAWAFEHDIEEGEHVLFTASDCRRAGVVTADGTIAAEVTPAGAVRILVGAGSDAPQWSKEGWICNDVEGGANLYEGITLIGPCWQLPVEDNSVDEIMARGMIEHLTYHEALASFKEWLRVLKPGAYFTGEVPDVEEYITEYLKMLTDPASITGEGGGAAEGEPDDEAACSGIDRWLRRALYGWQRWPGDEHRSGWTESLFNLYLKKAGASRVEMRRMGVSFEVDAPVARVRHLWARVWK